VARRQRGGQPARVRVAGFQAGKVRPEREREDAMPFRNILAALVAAASLHAAAGEYTDLWWNPQESGWGANIVQQGETAFVTLFVYGPDGEPTWYVAPAARTFAFDASGRPALRGTLYRTKGPWQATRRARP
jgi:hypothetical protein